jgi:BNR repeat-like domain
MQLHCLKIAAVPLFLVLSLSTHAGQPIELASGSPPHHPQQPQVAVDRAGGVHVVFGVGDQIRYCRSDSSGKSFTQPVHLPPVSNMSLGMRRGPRVAAGDGFLCITAIGGKQGKGRDGELFAFRSIDGGKSWQGPVTVNDEPAAAREGLHAMAAGPTGEICSVWLDLRSKGTKIFASASADGGATWTKNRLVYESPDGRVCECCHPSVTFDNQGGLYVMWRNSLGGNRDLYVCNSTDGGQTFSKAAKLGEGTWPLKACPMDGGAVAALAPGKLATAWRRDKQVFLTLPGEPTERLLGPGEQPWIAATAAGPYVVWLSKRGDGLQLLTPGAQQSAQLAASAGDPVIASAPSGRGPVVVAWEARDQGRYGIKCEVLE